MPNHDLKGIDTGKIGNNKTINYTFKDYQKDFGLSRSGAIKSLPKDVSLSDFQVIAPTIEQPNTILGKVAQFLGAGPGPTGETEIIDGKVVGKNRNKGIGRFTSGVADILTFGLTDFDKRGNLFGGTHSLSGYGGNQELDYKLPKSIVEAIEADKESKVDEASKDPYGDIDKLVEKNLQYQKEMDKISRKGRILDAAIESANMRANMPFITNTMKDLSTFKQRQLLDAEKIKQSFPNAVQARLATASSGFAQEAKAIEGQTDAATRFAQAGIRPSNVSFSA